MSYTIAGKKILNEYLALGTFGITGLSAWAATRGGSNDKKVDAKVEPKATATSDEEAAFLENFINDRVEHKEKAAAKH
ncbi:ATP19 family protein [Rhodotorula paludigena]|uniref:ATP19 family protein n=1 Tax=Rhodotorula paludigena TaxID=86838 RepID=UPI00317E686A